MNVDFLIGKRTNQLDIESKIDTKIEMVRTACGKDVIDFLITYRKYNRVLSKRLYDAPFYSMSSIYSKNMDNTNKIIEPIYMSSKYLMCEKLKYGVNEMNSDMLFWRSSN